MLSHISSHFPEFSFNIPSDTLARKHTSMLSLWVDTSKCAGYWSIDANAETAMGGSWKKGPGIELFNALKVQLSYTCHGPSWALMQVGQYPALVTPS